MHTDKKFAHTINVSRFAALLLFGFSTATPHVYASATEEHEIEEIVVTGSLRVTGGGAQDINFARGAALDGEIPHPDSITSEGLFSQHDLTLTNTTECAQLFCLVAQSMQHQPLTRNQDTHLIGLGFATALQEKRWRRDKVNIIAVVDKSGSMSGEPLQLVKRSLQGLASQLKPSDQLSIVLYGDRSYVHMPPIKTSDRNMMRIERAIKNISSNGSTNMEEGLAVGYDLARQTRETFSGATRVILFTDERPNVGATSADSFIGMAKAASFKGIGLTTIGVGVQFDSQLAVALSSTRGGNLYFVDSSAQAKALFKDELPYMVSELAHDIALTLTPTPGYRIGGVYGVPSELLSSPGASVVKLNIPSVFISKRGGGLFVSLTPIDVDLPAPEVGDGLMQVNLSYEAAGSGVVEESQLSVAVPFDNPSFAMRYASLLLDEFLALRQATNAHNISNDDSAAWSIMRQLSSRFEAIDSPKLARALGDEVKLTDSLLQKFAHLSGRAGERRSRVAKLWGDWRVDHVRGGNWQFDGDLWTFGADNQLLTNGDSGRYGEGYYVTRRQVVLPELEQAAYYRLAGNVLELEYMTPRGRIGRMILRRQ